MGKWQMTEESKSRLEIQEIMGILPHRFPFLLVDRLESVTAGLKPPSRVGVTYRATKNVTINEPFFAGHFPNKPVMPGVLIIEAMAQAGALACFKPEFPQVDVAIASIRDAKFRRPVVPGDTLEITGEVLRDSGSMVVIRSSCHVRGAVVAEAEVLAKMIVK